MSNDVTRIGRGVPVPQDRKPRRWFGIKPEFVIAAAVVISVAMMITAVFFFDFLRGAASQPGSTFMVVGEVRATGSGLAFGGHTGECRGTGGYSDLQEGAQVVVTNSAGRTVAIGRLGPGKSTTSGGGNGSVARLVACTFPIEVRDVPDGEAFYGITVTHRGTQQYTREQLNVPLRLSLG